MDDRRDTSQGRDRRPSPAPQPEPRGPKRSEARGGQRDRGRQYSERGNSQRGEFGSQGSQARGEGRRFGAAGEARDRGERPSRPPQDQRVRGPFVPEGIDHLDLDRDVRARLRSLSKVNAERVGQHLVLAGELLETDPELAYEHAQAAVRRAGRIDVVREAAALSAYATGRYAEALREFRTVRRLSGIDLHRAAEADCERGLGRPERALDVIAEAPGNLAPTLRAELAIVEAGARRDLGQPEMALIIIEDAPRTEHSTPRLDEVRADILAELGRDHDAGAIRAALPQLEADDLLGYEDLDSRAEYEPARRDERGGPRDRAGVQRGGDDRDDRRGYRGERRNEGGPDGRGQRGERR